MTDKTKFKNKTTVNYIDVIKSKVHRDDYKKFMEKYGKNETPLSKVIDGMGVIFITDLVFGKGVFPDHQRQDFNKVFDGYLPTLLECYNTHFPNNLIYQDILNIISENGDGDKEVAVRSYFRNIGYNLSIHGEDDCGDPELLLCLLSLELENLLGKSRPLLILYPLIDIIKRFNLNINLGKDFKTLISLWEA